MGDDNDKSKFEDVPPDPMFCVGDQIGDFTITEKIDEGGYGQVFKVSQKNKVYAMKIEYNSLEGGSAIKLETEVLTEIMAKKLPNFPKLFHAAKRQRYQYVVMELLGDNLKTLRYKSPNAERLSTSTWTRVGIQCLYILKTLHDIGFVHRDIKPANFAMGCQEDDFNSRLVYLFDFGISRRFIECMKIARPGESAVLIASSEREKKNKTQFQKIDFYDRSGRRKSMVKRIRRASEQNLSIFDRKEPPPPPPATIEMNGKSYRYRPARSVTDFRGTQVFASPNAHKNKELGRADDVWSLLYMIADMVNPLPWISDSEAIEIQKDTYKLQHLFKDEAFAKVEESIKCCSYYEPPDYELVYQTLKEIMNKSKGKWRDPYDWEMSESPQYLAWKEKSKDTVFPWEDPKGFFKNDPWAELTTKTPELQKVKKKVSCDKIKVERSNEKMEKEYAKRKEENLNTAKQIKEKHKEHVLN